MRLTSSLPILLLAVAGSTVIAAPTASRALATFESGSLSSQRHQRRGWEWLNGLRFWGSSAASAEDGTKALLAGVGRDSHEPLSEDEHSDSYDSEHSDDDVASPKDTMTIPVPTTQADEDAQVAAAIADSREMPTASLAKHPAAGPAGNPGEEVVTPAAQALEVEAKLAKEAAARVVLVKTGDAPPIAVTAPTPNSVLAKSPSRHPKAVSFFKGAVTGVGIVTAIVLIDDMVKTSKSNGTPVSNAEFNTLLSTVSTDPTQCDSASAAIQTASTAFTSAQVAAFQQVCSSAGTSESASTSSSTWTTPIGP